MNTILKVVAVLIVLAVAVICWYAWWKFDQAGKRLVYINERLDELDPGIRALSKEEEAERLHLLRELKEMT
jgi:hypothetical protein